MKKLLVINESMNFGGVARACINFIKNLKDDFQIDVLLLSKEGELLEELESMVPVYEANSRYKFLTIPWFKAKKMKSKIKLGKLFAYGLEKLSMQNLTLKWASKFEQQYNYDVCISYTQSLYSMDLALRKVNANKKFVVIHGELALLDKSKIFAKKLKQFDKALCVSESCKNQIGKHFDMSDKIDFLYNFQDSGEIIKLADKGYSYDKKKFNIVTVGRCCKEKGIDRLPEIISNLNKDIDVCWTIVGDGPLKQEIHDRIVDLNLKDKVNFVGYQSNPYFYIKNADLLAIISYSEAAPMVIGESFTLGVPVLTTNTTSSVELIKDYGYVCNNDTNAITEELNKILLDKEQNDRKKLMLGNYKYENDSIRGKAVKMIDD